jgi:uncharacterized membrane protein
MISTEHLHPMMVHFPVALVVIGFIAELASLYFKKEACLSKLSFYLLISGTVTALFALLAGVFFTSEMSGAAGEIQNTHEMFAWITLSTLIVTTVLRFVILSKKEESSGLQKAAFILYLLAAVCVSITGYFGGTLVFNYMMPI